MELKVIWKHARAAASNAVMEAFMKRKRIQDLS